MYTYIIIFSMIYVDSELIIEFNQGNDSQFYGNINRFGGNLKKLRLTMSAIANLERPNSTNAT